MSKERYGCLTNKRILTAKQIDEVITRLSKKHVMTEVLTWQQAEEQGLSCYSYGDNAYQYTPKNQIIINVSQDEIRVTLPQLNGASVNMSYEEYSLQEFRASISYSTRYADIKNNYPHLDALELHDADREVGQALRTPEWSKYCQYCIKHCNSF